MSAVAHLLLQLATVLGVAHLLRLVARRVGQPVVVAETMAGIVLGPSVLGSLAPRASTFLFPELSLSELGFVSEIGLIFFMFLVGLELDVRLLRGRMRAAATIIPAAALVPFALAVPLAIYLHARVGDPATKTVPFVLFVGAAMSVTAMPVLARILLEQRMLRTQLGTLAIACAAGVDAIAWCIVAFALAASNQRGWKLAVATTALVVAFVALMLTVVRPLLARVARRVRPTSHGMPHSVVAGAFLLLVLASVASDLAGVTPLLGAFLFGAIMPKGSGFARHLAEKIEDVVLVVFLPLFFAHSGLRTQIGLLHDAAAWRTCALVVLVGCVGKIGGSALAARSCGLEWREAGALGALMNTRGLMGLIALNVGLDLGILTPAVFTMMILMALVSTVLTAPLLEVIYPARLATRDALSTAVVHAPVQAKSFTVVACVPEVRRDSGLRTLACAMASLERSRVFALTLLPPTERASFLLDRQEEADAAEPAEGDALRPLSFVSSRPARDICDLADVKDADLILLEAGGVEREVVRAARTHVGVLEDRGLVALRRLVLVRPAAAVALGLATRLARGGGVEIVDVDSVDALRADGDLLVASADDGHAVRDAAVSVLYVRACPERAEESVSDPLGAGA